MNLTSLQRAIMAGAVVVALLLAFMLGKHVGARSAATARQAPRMATADDAPAPPRSQASPPRETPARETPPVALTAVPSSPLDPLTLDVHWSDTSIALDRARRELNDATTPNHGGWVEKARADLQSTLGDFNAAAAFFNDHPDLKGVPSAMSGDSESAVARVKLQELSKSANQGHMVGALEALQAALDALAQTSGGNLGGNRDKLIADIDATATDVVSGFNYLASGKTGPRADPATPERGGDLP